MTNKEAVTIARDYIADLFAADGAANVGLEELRFDPEHEHWLVTIGFTRGWEGPQGLSRWSMSGDREPWPRTFKTVEIDDATGVVLELKHWPVAA